MLWCGSRAFVWLVFFVRARCVCCVVYGKHGKAMSTDCQRTPKFSLWWRPFPQKCVFFFSFGRLYGLCRQRFPGGDLDSVTDQCRRAVYSSDSRCSAWKKRKYLFNEIDRIQSISLDSPMKMQENVPIWWAWIVEMLLFHTHSSEPADFCYISSKIHEICRIFSVKLFLPIFCWAKKKYFEILRHQIVFTMKAFAMNWLPASLNSLIWRKISFFPIYYWGDERPNLVMRIQATHTPKY